jgi:hypothetical protein
MKNLSHKWTVQDIPSGGQTCSGYRCDIGHRLLRGEGSSQEESHSDHASQRHEESERAAERIETELPKAQLYLAELDLAEFDSVRKFGEHPHQLSIHDLHCAGEA